MRLSRSFFTQPSLTVAEKLLGQIIVRKIGRKIIRGVIVETESYPGPHDRASHAYKGRRTARTEIEWNEGGYIYIYLVYGMYYQLNITTGKAGYPECVLIRALDVRQQIAKSIAQRKEKGRLALSDLQLANGPGKLCRWLKLDKSFYGEDITKSKRLYLAKGVNIKKKDVKKGPRINIDYAGPHYASRHWRFWIKNNKAVSK